ncbi:adenine phosphoribosyltransferase [Pelagivirga sediminicola]|uniref:Adenine phosphoribosyltransferase n=1 Tax=Pelagivirga sediminicola TaxID=2170575 RepID=A0A2T7G7T6_9RHOB|nr:adenine phosphoribosyltransferase [Pelagivirga sediminicola]PVA10437.1 adenine phosphoribosyltransferase [Pelagivirga sediminicola]
MPQKAIRDYIRTIPDFPKPGIRFRDVTTLLSDPAGLAMTIEQLADPYSDVGIDKVIGLEARGFILAGAVAHRLGAGFVPVRKAGKLPGAVISQSYSLEYGEATFELHEDAIEPGETVLIVDDLLATGGTAAAGAMLAERLGARIAACAFVVDLPDLGGHARLVQMGLTVQTLCAFEGD